MDNEFRTTFIPKQPIVPQSTSSSGPVSKPVGILFVVAVIIFIVSIVIGGGMYAYKTYLTKDVADLAVSLDRVQKSLDPNAIKEFTVMDKRLRNAQTLLDQHNVTYPLFDVLRSTTLPAVRYTKMDLSFNDTGDLAVTLSGESDGYRSIALQSQALSQNADLQDTIFSNFVVTPKGRVAFDVSFTIPRADLAFSKNLGDASGLNPANIDTTVTTPDTTTAQDTTTPAATDATVPVTNTKP